MMTRASVSAHGAGAVSVSVLALTFSAPIWADPAPCEVQKLLAPDGAVFDFFGQSVGVAGSVAVVGAPFDDDNGAGSGGAYVFEYDGSGWIYDAKLLAFDGATGDSFGIAVRAAGRVALVGAWRDGDNGPLSGSAYVFRLVGPTWTHEKKLLPNGGAPGDQFGWSVAINGEVAVVGAQFSDSHVQDTGAAYIFRFNGSEWVEEATVFASDGASLDKFGFAVSVSADRALVGASADQDNGLSSGSAYVFVYDGFEWIQEAKLLASDGAAHDIFGVSVALDGDVALVGAPEHDANGLDSGCAYVFRLKGSQWIQEGKFLASDGAAGDLFGVSVALDGDLAVVGANHDDDVGSDSGSAYVFRFDGSTWVQQAKLLPSDGAAGDAFGTSVSLDGDIGIVGATLNDDNGTNSGSSYVFGGVTGLDCNSNEAGDACEIASGTVVDRNANFVPDECECPWDLDGEGVVGFADFDALLSAWGPNLGHPADFNQDGMVGITDFLSLLSNWGPCLI